MNKNWHLIEKSILIIIVMVIGSLALGISIYYNLGEQHFSNLANSFLHGRLYFLNSPSSSLDMVFFNNHFYWPMGIFPTLLLLPLVGLFKIFGLFFYQNYLGILLIPIIWLLIYKISRKLKYSTLDANYLSLAFIFSSCFLGIVMLMGISALFAQIISVALIFLALLEYFNKKRWKIIGLIMGCAFLTRATAGLGIIFFMMAIWFLENGTVKEKIKEIWKLLWPFLTMVLISFIYNYLRFHSLLEQGYSAQLLGPDHNMARSYGLFNLKHLPGNLYYFLFKGPDPVFNDSISHVLKFPYFKSDFWGMSIFFTSPYLICLFFLKNKQKISKLLLLTCLTIAIPIFMYYGIGKTQFGYRYSLDFLPFLFLVFMINYQEHKKELGRGLKILIILSALFNFYLLFSRYV